METFLFTVFWPVKSCGLENEHKGGSVNLVSDAAKAVHFKRLINISQ